MILIVVGIFVALLIASQIYRSMATEKSEVQPFNVIRNEKDFEIRFYPAVTMATITSSARTYKALGSSGFRQLAGYIFGGNSSNQKIAMTSPVHMDVNDFASTMSFVMPAAYHKDNLPQPNDAGVKIETKADEYVAAIKFGGFASDKKIKEYADKLESALKANSIPYYGRFRFLGYNPPYQLLGRKNEIIVRVE
ncbi:MAG: hypothetical protein ACJA08_003335 [Cyclobacteriaceae bacterium]|jgi:hypothetical protein